MGTGIKTERCCIRYRYAACLIWLFLILPHILSAQKNDTVYLKNGDRLTGEIKKYSDGLILLSTEGLGKLNIEYDKICSFHSQKNFEIVKKTGFSYFGSIRKSATSGYIGIVISNDTVIEQINDIVEITQIRNKFWKKFYGTVDLGISYYKSTSTFQYNFSSTLNYRARKDLFSLPLTLFFSMQQTEDTLFITQKNDIALNYNHFFQGRFWGGVGIKYQQNTELELDYRYQIGVVGGYDIVRTNPVRFYVMVGLLANREKPTDSVNYTSNAEGLLAMQVTWLQHHHPKVNIASNINFFPSFTIRGRARLEFNLSVKYEVLRDLFVGVTFYDDYDSKPSGGGPSLNDWSAVFTIGYSF